MLTSVTKIGVFSQSFHFFHMRTFRQFANLTKTKAIPAMAK